MRCNFHCLFAFGLYVGLDVLMLIYVLIILAFSLTEKCEDPGEALDQKVSLQPTRTKVESSDTSLNSSFSNLSGPSDHGGTAGFTEDFETKPWTGFHIVLYVLVVSLNLTCSVL